jgi:hypothetical protein
LSYSKDKRDPKNNNIINRLLSFDKIPFIVLLIFVLVFHAFEKMQPGDDYWFKNVTTSYTFLDYIKWRYITWSGRVSVEGVLYFIFKDNGFMWRIINPIIITLFTYSISRLFVDNIDCKDAKKCMLNWYICIGWLFISNIIAESPVFWITGSINYLWPITAGLFAIMPFRDALMKVYNKKFNFVYLICAIFASIGQEQVTLILVGFASLINLHVHIRDRKIYKYLIFQNIIMIVGTLIMILAPGNFIRNNIEMNRWLPNYPLYSKWEIAFYGIQWLFNNLLHEYRIIFLLFLVSLCLALHKKNKGSKNIVHIFIPAICCFLIILGIIFSVNIPIRYQIEYGIKVPPLYNNIWIFLSNIFFDFSLPFDISKLTVVKFFIWPLIIILIPYLIAYIYDFKIECFYIVLIYIASICSALIMFISPTIYASGLRTLFILGTLFFIIFIILLKKSQILLKKRYVIIFAVLGIIKYSYFILYLRKL